MVRKAVPVFGRPRLTSKYMLVYSFTLLVQEAGIEPARESPPDFKSDASACSATPALSNRLVTPRTMSWHH